MSSLTAGSSSMSKSRSMLLSLLDRDSDVVLVFTAEDGTTEEVPAHSVILGQWSEVLRGALRAECGVSSRSGSGGKTSSSSSCGGKFNSSIPRIPMSDTKKDDWLLALEFVYPVVPQPALTWDNVERLLLLGDKYGMPALMERVYTFLQQHVGELNVNQTSHCYVWKWILLLDRYGLPVLAKACIDRQVDVLRMMDACPQTQLCELSSDTLQHLVLAEYGAIPRNGMTYCTKCKKVVKIGKYTSCPSCDCVYRD